MNLRDLAMITFKAMGVYWLVSAMLHILHGALMPFSDLGNLPANIWKLELMNWILTGAIYGVVSYLLLQRTDHILKLVKLNEDKETMMSSASAIDLKDMSFALLGMYFLVTASSAIIPHLIKVFSFRQPNPTARMFQEAYLEKSWTLLIENIVQCIFGAVLIIGRSRLTKLIQRLRPLSTANTDEPETKE
jgi:hypothetical protein